jgi:HD-GYP domain-containing protein (c-di-GMP phosphodiesterase class II)
MADGNAHLDVTRVHIERDSDPHLRDKLIERFVNLSGTLTRESSVAGVAKAIGTAALALSGAPRVAVYRRLEDGRTVCLWSQGFPAKQADRAPAMDVSDSGPVLLADQASWPLVRGGKMIGFVVCGFETPHDWSSSEVDILLALALHGAAALERAHLIENSGGRAEPEQYNAQIAEVLGIAQAESAQLAEAQRELEAQHARLVRARRTLGAVNVWLLALRHELRAELARLSAEHARVSKALDEMASEDKRLDAARQTVGPQLDAADQALERAHTRLAAISPVLGETAATHTLPQPGPSRQPLVNEGSNREPFVDDGRGRRTLVDDAPNRKPPADDGPNRKPPVDDARVSTAKRLSEAEHAKLLEALGLASPRPAEAREIPQPAAAPSLGPAPEPATETPPPESRPTAEPEFSYELGGPLPVSHAPEDLYPLLIARAAELLRANGQPLTAEQQLAILGRALDDRDGHRAGYGERLASWSEAVAGLLGCGREEMEDIRRAALLHDLGKVGVPEAILRTMSVHTDGERSIMRLEPIVAEQILRPVKGMEAVALILRHRYERWDGKGYPDGLQGSQIPLGARILGAVDAYGAMTTVRRYRTMVYALDAVAELRHCAGSQFDPRVVEAFCGVLKREQ